MYEATAGETCGKMSVMTRGFRQDYEEKRTEKLESYAVFIKAANAIVGNRQDVFSEGASLSPADANFCYRTQSGNTVYMAEIPVVDGNNKKTGVLSVTEKRAPETYSWSDGELVANERSTYLVVLEQGRLFRREVARGEGIGSTALLQMVP